MEKTKASDYVEERYDTDFSITIGASDLSDNLIDFSEIRVKEFVKYYNTLVDSSIEQYITDGVVKEFLNK